MRTKTIPDAQINDIDEVKRMVFCDICHAREVMKLFYDEPNTRAYTKAKAQWEQLTDLVLRLGWWDEFMDFDEVGEIESV